MRVNYLLGLVLLGSVISCTSDKSDEKKFRLVSGTESGITFRNDLKPSVEFNIFNYMYFYNGGGVATGDLNGDGLADVYFTSNQNQNKLYLNKGGFKFEDVTEASNAAGLNSWATGVTMADVNSDGKLDIYVSYVGNYLIYQGRNQLLINEGNDEKGVPRFVDKAVAYGLDLVGFSTQAAFFDYDRDGDLDMYMLNHSLHQNGTFGASSLRYKPHPLAGDKLMRNDGSRFTDVTQQSGIYSSVIGYGLGIVVSDVNMDGFSDIYVGNDFHENDYLYINQGNGTFKDVLEKSMQHTSHFSMGCDFADFNNDAFPDLISMDMLPQDPLILKASAAEDSYDLYAFKLNYGYNYQFARNTFQLNQNDGTFSEIGLMAGVYATDWSWSALFADMDLDGYKDIFISNGIERRSNDLDYINFITEDSIQMRIQQEMREQEMNYFKKMPQIKIPNALYINNRDSTFTNKAMDWGMHQPSYSHGTAYADLDNDGDLDLVINNAADEAFLYENLTRSGTEIDATANGFLQVSLKGRQGNTQGIGSKVFLYNAGKVQVQECMPTRGFQSAVDTKLTFGLGAIELLDSVVVIWPDQAFQTIKSVGRNQKIVLDRKDAFGAFDYKRFHAVNPIFRNTTAELSIPFRHQENKFVEFNRESLIPHMVSTEGPGTAVADVNGDGLDDLYFGNGKWKLPALFIQQKSGGFKKIESKILDLDSTYEEVDAEFFDADNDGDNDLFVVSGGNEWNNKSVYMQSRLYLNEGSGAFSKSKAIPDIFMTGAAVCAGDYDNDGDKDIFLGARAIPWNYGLNPDSYLLLNDGKGNFTIAGDEKAGVLKGLGLVKDARWIDTDKDGDLDLVIAAEWSPITVLINDKGTLSQLDITKSGLEKSEGWWNVIEPQDFDGDGDIDFVFGNLGLNSKLKATVAKPVKLFVGDFDKNESIEQVLTHFIGDKEYPFYTRDEMTKQMPYLKKKFLSYHKYAEASLQDVFSKEQLDASKQLIAHTFEHVYVENLGGNTFKVRPLPKATQISSVNAIVSTDVDGDGKLDLIVAGNFYPVNVQLERYDASYGQLLMGDGKGHFVPIPPYQSGISINGETRGLKKILVNGKEFILAIRNNDSIVSFSIVK